MLYTLHADNIAGVFKVDLETGEEQRLFHSDSQRVEHVAATPGGDSVACSIWSSQGTASIGTMRADGSYLREITEGDSVDLFPTWIPGAPGQILFQSAGIGRDQSGVAMGLGPVGIRRIDLNRGTIDELADDERSDFLGPRASADGTLYYIRRPRKEARGEGSPWKALLDFILFPFRLVMAIFHWLNFFTARFTGKPMTTAGGAKQKGADMKQMMIWGNLIDAADESRKGVGTGEDTPSVVPNSWELMRQPATGDPEVVAKGAVSFDLCEDGAIVYTNGNAIFVLDAEGNRRCLHKDAAIEQVAVVG